MAVVPRVAQGRRGEAEWQELPYMRVFRAIDLVEWRGVANDPRPAWVVRHPASNQLATNAGPGRNAATRADRHPHRCSSTTRSSRTRRCEKRTPLTARAAGRPSRPGRAPGRDRPRTGSARPAAGACDRGRRSSPTPPTVLAFVTRTAICAPRRSFAPPHQRGEIQPARALGDAARPGLERAAATGAAHVDRHAGHRGPDDELGEHRVALRDVGVETDRHEEVRRPGDAVPCTRPAGAGAGAGAAVAAAAGPEAGGHDTMRVALVALPRASVALMLTAVTCGGEGVGDPRARRARPVVEVHCVELTGDHTSSGDTE